MVTSVWDCWLQGIVEERELVAHGTIEPDAVGASLGKLAGQQDHRSLVQHCGELEGSFFFFNIPGTDM